MQTLKKLALAMSLCSVALLTPHAHAQTDAGVAPPVDAARPDYPRLQNESGDAWVCAARPSTPRAGGGPTTALALGLALGVWTVRRSRVAR